MLTTRHTRVLDRLVELMDFRDDPRPSWKCGRGEDRFFYTKQALAEIAPGMTVEQLLEALGARHRCCDCEIVFNTEWESVEPERNAKGDSDRDDDSREENSSGNSEDGVQHG